MNRYSVIQIRAAARPFRVAVTSVSLCMVFVATAAGCDGNSLEGNDELHQLEVGGHTFYVEIADSEEERAEGLMFRDELPENHGMLFVFERDQRMSFWMKNTSIPLSIAYISSDGTIREIHDMEPHDLTPVRSSRSLRYALEVNQGAFQRNDIEVGDRVDFSGLPGF